jgi:IgGFc binding protein
MRGTVPLLMMAAWLAACGAAAESPDGPADGASGTPDLAAGAPDLARAPDLASAPAGDPCAPEALGKSYIGCEYYPTVTANMIGDAFHFSVAVSNATASPAHVTIDGGALASPLSLTVAAGDVVVQTLPWVADLRVCDEVGTGSISCEAPTMQGALVAGGAYHLKSDRPVSVYQFSPLEYELGAEDSFSNDASLLLPANALGQSYLVAAYHAWTTPSGNVHPDLVAVTATVDGTTVSITSNEAIQAGKGSPAFAVGVAQTVTLDRGDVLQLLGYVGDLTGSSITANQPIQVIAGHYCTFVPNGTPACDHLEESMPPRETLGAHYLATAPALISAPAGNSYVLRVIATQADTHVTYLPPQLGAPKVIAQAGGFVELETDEDIEITTDHNVLVVEYMVGQGWNPTSTNSGDPSLTVVPPVDQYRGNYLFHAPLSYQVNFVTVTAPHGVAVTLDGQPVSGFVPVGISAFDAARVTLGAGQNGTHRIQASAPFGISVYGYGHNTSYWYPGGLDVNPLPIF